MSDSSEDFAAMFEASIKAKRYENGQTIEGTIVAIGPEVAFVDVGGKGEATIEVGELKDDDGDIDVAVGDRIQAMVVSTAGGVTLSRKLARGAPPIDSSRTRSAPACRSKARSNARSKGGYEVRIGRARAFCPHVADRHRADGPGVVRRPRLRVPDHRVQGRRAATSSCRGARCSRSEQKAAAADVRRRSSPARC